MKQFDDIFRENVNKAFSNFNADHLADEGWKSFVEKRKERRRPAVVIPVWVRAASIVLLIGLGALITYRLSTPHIDEVIISGTETVEKKDKETALPEVTSKTITPVVVPAKETEYKGKSIKERAGDKLQAYTDGNSLSQQRPLNSENILLPVVTESRILIPDVYPDLPAPGTLIELRKKLTADNTILVTPASEEHIPVKETHDEEKHYRGRTLLAGLSGLIAKSGRNSSPASGLTAGIYLDQKITRKLSVRPGLALAGQSFRLENNSSTAGFNYPVSLNDGTIGRPYSYNGQLSMLAMELPLNIVIRIIDKERSGIYVSAGASTMIYISQQFAADFVNEYTKESFNTTTGMYSSETRYSTVKVKNNYSAFSRADFFGLANFSAGYSFPYSKTGTMLIEPYLQLPVSDLTSLNLRIRYGGISMKLRFGKQEAGK